MTEPEADKYVTDFGKSQLLLHRSMFFDSLKQSKVGLENGNFNDFLKI